jgi:molybdopterin molybdotransferase
VKEFFKVLDIDEVLALIPGFERLGAEEVGLEHACDRVLAEDVAAAEDLPGFPRAVVDGFAVRAAATYGASEGQPALLEIAGAVAMGERPAFRIAGSQAARIPTGGMLPEGADSVVMIEHADVIDAGFVEVLRSVAPGQNMVAADEDFRAGEIVLRRGRRLRPQDAGALAAVGRTHVGVFRRPVVGIISTGDEIVPAGERPGPGRVRDVNSLTLAGLAAQIGASPRPLGIVPDDFAALKGALERALSQCDMVLVSGGSSVGTRDLTVEAIRAFPDAEILAHGIAISPGKPTILARAGGRAVWGLPGHVVSAMIVFARIVRPFLLHVGGLADPREEARRLSARLTRNVASAMGRTDFVRARLHGVPGDLRAEPLLGKSALINTMVRADGMFEIGKNLEGLAEGAAVEVIPF